MLKVGILTEADRAEAFKLQRRKIYEDERKKRIFDSRTRSIGLDKPALERQILERNKMQNLQDEYDRAMEEQTQLQQQAVYKRSKEEEKMKKQIAKDIDYFRCKFQKPEMRSEYDLNDPLALRKAKPLRSADDDINLGISSAQVFDGEDMGKLDRQVIQREQQRSWLQQQMQERRSAIDSRIKADRLMDNSAYSRDQSLGQLALSFEKIRLQVGKDINRYNQELARIKEEERKKLKKETEEDNMAEIYNMVTSDLLAENSSNRLSPQELKDLKEQQHKQLLERRKHLEDMEIMEKQWERYAINMDRELMLKELELERKEKELVRETFLYNEDLAKVQVANRKKIDKELGKNFVSDEFYNQFNKDSR